MARPKNTKNIATPELMWDYFLEYVGETKSNPRKIKDWVGKDAMEVYREKENPLTMEGFSMWLFNNGITSNLHDYMANTLNLYEEYSNICSRVKEAIRKDQIEGGMAGIFNPSITQRLNGLVEKTETNIVREQPLFPDEPKE